MIFGVEYEQPRATIHGHKLANNLITLNASIALVLTYLIHGVISFVPE